MSSTSDGKAEPAEGELPEGPAITAADEAAVRASAEAGEADALLLVRDSASLLREADEAVRAAQLFTAGRRASSAGIAAPYMAMLASERAGEVAAAASRRAAGEGKDGDGDGDGDEGEATESRAATERAEAAMARLAATRSLAPVGGETAAAAATAAAVAAAADGGASGGGAEGRLRDETINLTAKLLRQKMLAELGLTEDDGGEV
jgi:hypothetical protein